MKDQTQFLSKHNFWPSYNVPFYPEVFNRSGGWANVAKYGDWFTYDKTPRALIFHRDAPGITDVAGLIRLMRSNAYRSDDLSRCNCTPPYSAENAISARCDLNPANGSWPFASLGHRSHGGIDMKATDHRLAQQLQMLAISGPTFGGPDALPPFQWNTSSFPGQTPHYAHPNLWAFPTIQVFWNATIITTA